MEAIYLIIFEDIILSNIGYDWGPLSGFGKVFLLLLDIQDWECAGVCPLSHREKPEFPLSPILCGT